MIQAPRVGELVDEDALLVRKSGDLGDVLERPHLVVGSLAVQSAGYRALVFSFRRLQRRLVVTLRRCKRAISSS